MKPCAKQPYPTKQAAKKAMRWLTRYKSGGWAMCFYFCKEHNAWHLSSKLHGGARKVPR